MGKARSITIATRTFAKAGDATLFFREMLNRYKVGDRVSDADGLDLAALVERHDEKAEKIGGGIAYFSVEAAPEPYSGQCFWIVRVDGSRIDILILTALRKSLTIKWFVPFDAGC
jgi:hypothetical protein